MSKEPMQSDWISLPADEDDGSITEFSGESGSRKVHQFYFVKFWPYKDPEKDSKLRWADQQCQLLDREKELVVDDKTMEIMSRRDNICSELDRKKWRHALLETGVEWTTMVVGFLQAAIDVDGSSSSKQTETAARQPRFLMSSLRNEIPRAYFWYSQSNNREKLEQILKEVERIEDGQDEAKAAAAAQGDIWDPLNSKRAMEEQIELLNKIPDELRPERYEVMAEIKCLEDGLEVLKKEDDDLSKKFQALIDRKSDLCDFVISIRKEEDDANACYNEYVSLMRNANELAARKDVKALEQLSSSQVSGAVEFSFISISTTPCKFCPYKTSDIRSFSSQKSVVGVKMENGVKFANNLRTDSLDYRAELLSPTPVGENHVTMASEQSWRLNVDKFQLPDRHKEYSSCFSLGYYIKALSRQRRLSRYYKRQEELVKGYNEIDTFNELGILPGSLSEEEMKQLARNERLAIYASNVANLVLFLAKVYASVMSRSLAVIASTLDSLLDLLSGFILWFTASAMRKPNQFHYPIGKNRMQPVGIVVFASVMATLGLQILFESGRELIIKAQPDRDPVKEKWMIGIMVSVTVVKFVLVIYCRRFENEIIRAYAQDHFFDVITNSIGLGTAVLAIKFYWWIDPIGAILIALYTMGNWANTVMENVWGLIGTTAPPEYLAKLTYLIWNHCEEIRQIETVRAYSFGSYYFVEVHIILPEDMSLVQSHNIGRSLKHKLEQLPEVERAFVHIDLDNIGSPEHKPKKSPSSSP
ncbi:hypothetical protein V6N11_064489 [Hibiscus sabdariffa]|uniref:Cation efflux protein cytoplasmic domain-containing protein n=1 Tax=Hibiscus sabdariffa TaxID=183260 RepID=A0ABR1ZGD4_9ROSI